MSTVPDSEETALRAFVSRVLGWRNQADVEHALRSIRLSTTHRAALVLLGDPNLVPVARALHRRTLGDGPFVACHPRRLNMPTSVRSAANRRSGVAAVREARGGSLCITLDRLPDDFSSMAALVRDPLSSVQLIVCADARYALDPFLVLPVPLRVPPLSARVSELPRIVDEYALDAIRTLGAGASGFTEADRAWVLGHAARTLSEIENATLRLVALRKAGNVSGAAELLGVSRVALGRWFGRRRSGRRIKAPP